MPRIYCEEIAVSRMVFVYKYIIKFVLPTNTSWLGEYGEKASSEKISLPSLLFLPTGGAVWELDGSVHWRLLSSLFQDFFLTEC